MEKNSTALRKFSVLLLAASITTAFSGMSTVTAHAATVKPTKISVKSTLSMTTADPAKLSVKVYPSKAKASLKYSSSNTSVASVSSKGTITGKKLGTATITVKTKGANGKTLSKKVKVKVGICSSTKTSEVKKYASDTNANTVLIDARSADAYSGWALDGAKRGGHLSNAVNFSANWLTCKYSSDSRENKSRTAALDKVITSNGMTKSKSYIVYDTNGKDAKAVATYLINKKGFRKVCTYNAKSLINKSTTKTSSYKNYKMNVPASLVKNISDHVVNGTALNSQAKSIVNGKNIVILDVAWGDETADPNNGSGHVNGHVPGAVHVNTDEFETPAVYVPEKSEAYRSEWRLISDSKLIALAESKGVTKDSCVILTGCAGGGSSLGEPMAVTRMAVILKYLGVDNVHVMSGGMVNWYQKGYALQKGNVTPKKVSFGATTPQNPDVIDTISEVKSELTNSKYQVIDTRTAEEWKGLSSGYSYHDLMGRIANTTWSPSGLGYSSSMYYYRNPDKTMISKDMMDAMWKKQGVDTSKHLVFFCGSGWRAAETTWDAWVLGYDASLYSDGWIAWSNEGNPYIDKNGNTVYYDKSTNSVVTDSTASK